MVRPRLKRPRRHGALEDPQSRSVLRYRAREPRPARMVDPSDVPLGMGHQAEDPARRVADAGDGAERAVGVGRILLGRPVRVVDVLEDDLARSVERVDGRRVGEQELALAVGDGQLDRLAERDERREARAGQQPDPAGLEPARVVVRQGRGAGRRARRARGRTNQDLKPVADAQDQTAAVVEPPQGVAQRSPESGGEDPAGAQVVAVREAAGNGQDLEPIERPAGPRAAGRRARSRRRPRPAARRRPSPRRSWCRGLAGRSRGAGMELWGAVSQEWSDSRVSTSSHRRTSKLSELLVGGSPD